MESSENRQDLSTAIQTIRQTTNATVRQMILILGAADELHVSRVRQKLEERDIGVVCLDTWEFPARVQMAVSPDEPTAGFIRPAPDRDAIALSEIRAVYWRAHRGINVTEVEDAQIKTIAFREIESAFGSLFRNLPCLWVNSVHAVEQHRYKAHQLLLLKQAGLCVPGTLISNDPVAVRDVYERYRGEVIYKPVRGGAHTARLTEEDLTQARLAELAKAPVQFQEFISGTDILVYVVGDKVFAAEIQTEALDFRRDPNPNIVPIRLPDTVIRDCFTLTHVLGLVFSGIDIRRTPQGEYIFLEGNPSPMFRHFEDRTGYPISDRLVDLLLEKS